MSSAKPSVSCDRGSVSDQEVDNLQSDKSFHSIEHRPTRPSCNIHSLISYFPTPPCILHPHAFCPVPNFNALPAASSPWHRPGCSGLWGQSHWWGAGRSPVNHSSPGRIFEGYCRKAQIVVKILVVLSHLGDLLLVGPLPLRSISGNLFLSLSFGLS